MRMYVLDGSVSPDANAVRCSGAHMAAGVTRALAGFAVRGPRRVPVGEWHAGRRPRRRAPGWLGVRPSAGPADTGHQARAVAIPFGLHEP